MKTSRGFTLIELLIVIAIIGILMSLLFPAAGAAIDSARKVQAKNDVTQIATAVIAFETEYGRLPLPTKEVVDSALMEVLTGLDTNNNPRQIVFLEANVAKRGKSGTNSSGFVDPWAILENVPSSTYKIRMDNDYDNEVSVPGSSDHDLAAVTLRKKVAVWSEPQGTPAKQKRRVVKSWE